MYSIICIQVKSLLNIKRKRKVSPVLSVNDVKPGSVFICY